MVLGLITLVATVPLIATSTLSLQDSAQNTQAEADVTWKTQKCHLNVRATTRMDEKRKDILKGKAVILRDGKLFVDTLHAPGHHPFTGYFLPYPNRGYDGIVSTINKDNMLNWVFVDSRTYEMRYGVRADAERHLSGPMAMVAQGSGERRLTFRGWEGFVAVEESDGAWALYFDMEDDGLKAQKQGRRVTEVELVRTEAEMGSGAQSSNDEADDQPD